MFALKTHQNMDLTRGPVGRVLFSFTIPLLFGQFMQQLYNTADAWVLGRFCGEASLAAVTSTGSLNWLIIGFFSGISIGGGVVISKYVGMRDPEAVGRAIHSNFFWGIWATVIATMAGVLLSPWFLRLMSTPDSVMTESLTYLRIYFAGIATVVFYNICMSVMRAMGDSYHPLLYLTISSLTNIVLDLLFVALFGWGVAGAAIATILGQGLSCVLCVVRLTGLRDEERLEIRRTLRWDGPMLKEIMLQGIPTGIQNSVISVGNMTIQSNINLFDQTWENGLGMVIAGHGAYSKIEGFVFLPISCLSMSLPTFIGQNLGARCYDRAKKGAVTGILSGMVLAELFGFFMYFCAEPVLSLFVASPVAIRYGAMHARTVALFFFLLAFSHCASGVLRGCGKSVIPMVSMLSFWCVVRVLYVTFAIRYRPVFSTISWAYPITWCLSSVLLFAVLLKSDWTHGLEGKSDSALLPPE